MCAYMYMYIYIYTDRYIYVDRYIHASKLCQYHACICCAHFFVFRVCVYVYICAHIFF